METRFKLITADRILDGTGSSSNNGCALLIDGKTVSAIGNLAEIRAPDGSDVARFDYGDATIMPGLVDAHTHLMAPGDGTLGDDVAKEHDDILLMQAVKNARTVLHSGVTTVRENGAKNRVAFSLREGVRRGLAAGPNMVICGRPVTITGGHMWYCGSEADGEDAVRKEVRKLVKEGADYIKIMATGGSTRSSFPNLPSYSVAELRAITDEAHKLGLLTAAHCASAQGITNSLEAEVDMIIHCAFEDAGGRYSFRDDIADQLADAGAWVNPTLAVIQASIDFLEEKRSRNGKLSPSDNERVRLRKRTLEQRLETTGRLEQMGVRVTAGSDSPWGEYPAGNFVNEVKLLAHAGLTNSKAVLTATSGSATSIGVADKSGRLALGRQADVLVVRGNPLQDISALENVVDVFQAGQRVYRQIL